jgi:prevent-host-death family protein
MTTVTVHEAKTHLSRLIAEVLAGGEVVIAPRGKKPAVKIVPFEEPKPAKRLLGHLAHTLSCPGKDPLEDGFWDRLSDEELGLWNCEVDDPNDKI